jgi:aldose sugar dehydrogenase
MRTLLQRTPLLFALLISGCGSKNNGSGPLRPGGSSDNSTTNSGAETADANPGPAPTSFTPVPVAQFDEPWAMTFLPDGRLLVTEKPGALKLMAKDATVTDISGAPEVDDGGQGGLGDIILAPDYSESRQVYLSWIEAGDADTRGAVVGRATLNLDDQGGGSLGGLEILWRQTPKVTGRGHYAHRLAFSPDGAHLFITSGDRQKFDPAQDMSGNLGKIVRLHPDGSVPRDNPFADQGGVAAQVWTLGHRNPLGFAFDGEGRLWQHEMGPKGGDEFNLILRGRNYGWPIVSDGEHYDGEPIPDHETRPGFEAPKVSWSPVISPAGMIIYSGSVYTSWKGDAFLGGLSSQALIRVELGDDSAREAERWDMGQRIREVEQGPSGTIWLLEDGPAGSGGRLLELRPRFD